MIVFNHSLTNKLIKSGQVEQQHRISIVELPITLLWIFLL